MGSSASLDRPELAVEPGQQVAAQLRVRNNGSVVDQFTFESLGDGAAWIDVEPPTLSLFPGAEGTVTVQFRPPRSSNVAPGPTPFGIKVVSAEDATGSAVEEGVVTVGRFADRTVELYPLTARGRRRGRFEIAVDNRGNAPIDVELTGSDPESSCAFQFASQAVRVEPGTAQFTKFAVVPQRTFWRGPPKTHQFQVVVTERTTQAELPAPVMAGTLPSPPPVAPPVPPPAGPPPQTVNGSLMQEALLPPWLIKAVLAAIAILLVLWILWMTLFKPTVESVARDAVEAPLSSLAEQVDALTPPDTPGGDVPPSGGDDSGGGGGGGGATTTTTIEAGGGGGATTTTDPGSGVTTTTAAPPTEFLTPFGNPADFQLGTGAVVGAGTSQSFGNEFSNSFAVTDMVLQNPTGDIGTVQILRDGHLLLSSALENFRDLDLHFVAPYMFQPGQSLIMTITCTTPGPGSAGCTTSASFGGFGR
ncbi:MAG: hypothetical protein AB7L17_15375 [Ilumatobacteraceae bacterium]